MSAFSIFHPRVIRRWLGEAFCPPVLCLFSVGMQGAVCYYIQGVGVRHFRGPWWDFQWALARAYPHAALCWPREGSLLLILMEFPAGQTMMEIRKSLMVVCACNITMLKVLWKLAQRPFTSFVLGCRPLTSYRKAIIIGHCIGFEYWLNIWSLKMDNLSIVGASLYFVSAAQPI